VMVFFLSIMPLVVDVKTLTPARLAGLMVVCVPIIAGTLMAYALAANRARALFRSARAMRVAHRAAAGVMASVAVAVAVR
jgi:threonine/homoserine/homoserine lactone efflux protein